MPPLSIIVPVAGQEPGLRACLESLRRLSEDCCQVLVICQGPAARERVAALAAPEPAHWRVLVQPPAGPGAARSLGLAQAQGELILFLGPDCAIPPHLPRALGEIFAAEELAGAVLALLPAPGAESLSHLAALVLEWDQFQDGLPTRACAAFSRAELMALGGLEPDLPGPDGDLLDAWLRLRAQGRPLAGETDLFARAPLPSTWPGLLAWALEDGRRRFLLLRLGRGLPPGTLRHQLTPGLQVILALLTPALLAWLGPQAPDRAVTLALLCILLLYPLNRPFLRWLSEHGPGVINQALLLCLLRPFAWLAGMLAAALDRMGGGVK